MTAVGAIDLQAADFDADGDTDIVSVSQGDHHVRWHVNQGGGLFGSVTIIDSGSSGVNSVVVGDVNLDGFMDVIIAETSAHRVNWYKNQGNGAFGPRWTIADSATNATSVDFNDIDGDGDGDVVYCAPGKSAIEWYPNDLFPHLPFPGTGDDLQLLVGPNSLPYASPGIHELYSGNILTGNIQSPGGTLAGPTWYVVAQVFPTGSALFSNPALPRVHLNTDMGLVLPTVVLPYSQSVLQANGISFGSLVSATLIGQSIRCQGLVLSPATLNGVYAATSAAEFRIR